MNILYLALLKIVPLLMQKYRQQQLYTPLKHILIPSPDGKKHLVKTAAQLLQVPTSQYFKQALAILTEKANGRVQVMILHFMHTIPLKQVNIVQSPSQPSPKQATLANGKIKLRPVLIMILVLKWLQLKTQNYKVYVRQISILSH